MGDVADMILDGILDEQTGEYLGPGVGYPRTRNSNYEYSERQQKLGILSYLRGKGVRKRIEQTEMITSFLDSIDVKHSNLSKDKMCSIISQDFQKFASFCNKKFRNQ